MRRILSLAVIFAMAASNLSEANPQYEYAQKTQAELARQKAEWEKEKRNKDVTKTKAVDSPFEACKDVALLDSDDYRKQKSYWDEVLKECGGNGQLQLLPETGLTVLKIQNAAESSSFLQEVGDKALKILDANISHLDTVKDCFGRGLIAEKSVSDQLIMQMKKCDNIKSQVKDLIKKVQPEARLHLALAGGGGPYMKQETTLEGFAQGQESFEIPAANKMIAQKLGDGMSSSMLPDGLEPFTSSERSKAEKVAMKKAHELNDKVSAGELSAYEAANLFNQWKTEQKLQYVSKLQQAPVLAYLGATNIEGSAGDQAIFKASIKLLENAKAERKRIAKTIAEGKIDFEAGGSKSDQAKSMLDFMIYQPIIEDMLKKDQRLCSTATGLAKHVEKSQWRKMGAIGAGVVGAGILATVFFPPALLVGGLSTAQLSALALGPPITVAMATHDYKNLQAAKRGAWNSIGSEGGGSIRNSADVEDARSTLNWTGILSPIDVIGTGVGGATARFFKHAAARNALAAKGIGKEEANKLIKLSTSKTSGVAKEAQERIDAAALNYVKAKTGLSKAEDLAKVDKLTKTMTEKGFAGTADKPNTKYVDEVLAAIKKMEKKEFIDDFTKIFEKFNPAKANEMTRGQKVKAAIAMSNFGIKDADRAARMLSDWDEGIEGFTKTVQLATKKLNSRELASVGDIAERQRKAWDGAVDDLMEKSPYFKNQSPEARQAAKAEMKNKCNVLF